QYQVQVDPDRLQARGVSVGEVAAAIRSSNDEVGGRVIEMAEHEYSVRGRGYIRDASELELAVVATRADGIPIRIKDVATVTVGGNLRRGLAELDGQGEVVAGIVVMRSGENALDVIGRVKARLEVLRPTLPAGVEVLTVYDRSTLIDASVKTLATNVVQILVIILLVIGLFLFHLRSALVSAVTLVIATLGSFIAFYLLKVTINIMSLAGVILALGDMVDSGVVLVENAHKKIEAAQREGRQVDRGRLVIDSARELGPSMFSALLVLTVAFLPVFVLAGEEGRLFRPLALAKTASMAIAAVLSVTLVPALMVLLLKGKIRPEQHNPINRWFVRAYRPVLRFCLERRRLMLGLALGLTLLTALPFVRLGSEFMPPLYEGDLLFMPITVPSIPIEQARSLLRWQDAQIRSVPEVAQVFGKAGRAETATDPAPLSMFETVVTLRPRDEWREGMTVEKVIAELDRQVVCPGVQGAWTMPIKARVDMLSTGIRTPIGVKVFGKDLAVISSINDRLERVLRTVPGTRSVYAERELGGFFLDITPDREAIARYGVTVREVLDVVESVVGGMDVASTYEGRERYRINVRYPRELRDDLDALGRIRVPVRAAPGKRPALTGGAIAAGEPEGLGPVLTSGMGAMGGGAPAEDEGDSMGGPGQGTAPASGGGRAWLPLSMLARIETVMGPPMIKSEQGSLTGWVYVDLEGRDVGGYVDDAKKAVARELALPPGYSLQWTGQYELLERVRARMAIVVPLTLALVFLILYLTFRGVTQTLLVMTGVPFAAVGAIWTLFILGFNTSVAVWVGLIALLGVAAETASVMVVYLDEAWIAGRASGKVKDTQTLIDAAVEAGTLRIRPLLMTVATNIFGLLPVLFASGIGSDVAKRIAAPMWGGLVSLTALTLLIIPVAWVGWRGRQLPRGVASGLSRR
ncbi:MAG: cation transporter, partial [Myxococcaceae bacterium]|nr:cation transporter [Myxococcaceae bacterium]